MIKKIICQNSRGNQITFSYSFPYYLQKIDGVTEVAGKVNTIKSAYGVGSKYISSSIDERNILIEGSITRDNITEKRKNLYKMFPLKDKGTFFYYEEDKEYKIEYYVESIDIIKSKVVDKFSISLICPSPYFTDLNESKVQLANWIPSFEFPLEIPANTGIEFGYKNTNSLVTIENDTNIEIGMRIVFTASDDVENPKLINITTQEELEIEKNMSAGDVITVTTYLNNKNIILSSNGEEININNYLKFGTKFLQIHTGSNTFKATAKSGENSLITEIYYLTNYEAV